jgi:hypothetical protein
MVQRIREVSGKPVGFKAVMGAYGWMDGLFEEVNNRGTMAWIETGQGEQYVVKGYSRPSGKNASKSTAC